MLRTFPFLTHINSPHRVLEPSSLARNWYLGTTCLGLNCFAMLTQQVVKSLCIYIYSRVNFSFMRLPLGDLCVLHTAPTISVTLHSIHFNPETLPDCYFYCSPNFPHTSITSSNTAIYNHVPLNYLQNNQGLYTVFKTMYWC